MTDSTKRIIAIATFYIIAIALRYYVAIVKPDFIEDSNLYIRILMRGIGPLIGGIFVIKILKRPHGLSLFSIGFLKTVLVISVPIVLFSLIGLFNTGVPYFTAPKITAVIILYALFEEYGWRNYLQSELSSLNRFTRTAIITVMWYVWHLDFGFSMGNLIFLIILFAGSWGIGLIAEKTKSLVLVALFHSLFNLFQSELLEGVEVSQKLIILAVSVVVAIVVIKYDEKKSNHSAVEKLAV